MRLAEILSQIKGRFIMSLNDVEAVRETFDRFHILPVQTRYSISKDRHDSGAASEVLISNYPLPDVP